MNIKPDSKFTLIINSWILLGILIMPSVFILFILYFALKYGLAYFTNAKFTENGIIISEGFISKKVISILKSKINSIQINQSFLQKPFGVCTLIIMTGNDSVTQIKDIKLDLLNQAILEQKFQEFILI